jgi:hypothetical protein
MVEGQLIYNFGIDCLWHFSCEKSRNGQSKGAKLKCLTLERACTPPARATSCTAGRPATVPRRTRMPRQTSDPWSVRGAKGLLCVVLLGPGRRHALHSHTPGGRTAFGHWLAAPPTKRHWLAACTVFAPCRGPPCDDSRDLFAKAHLPIKARPTFPSRDPESPPPPLEFLGELPCPFEPRTF